jgi:hypothetical protein
VVHESKVGLRPGITISGGTLIPGNSFLAVLPDGFFSILVLGTKFKLGLTNTVAGGTSVPFNRFIGVSRHFFSTIVLNAQFVLSLGVTGIGSGTQGEEVYGRSFRKSEQDEEQGVTDDTNGFFRHGLILLEHAGRSLWITE